MLLGILCYPFGYDQAAFSVAGEMISRIGAIPYRDFLDTKPPLIFFLYSLASLIFGHHEWSIRAFDVLYQAGAAFYLYKITTRYTERSEALIAAGLYLILYAGTGYWMTSQAESFATLPSLLLIDATLRQSENPTRWLRLSLLGGLALAMLFLLKFTFVLGLGGVLLFLALWPNREHLKFTVACLGSFAVLVGIYLLFLWTAGGLEQFLESLRWVARYSSIDPLFAPVTIAQRYNESFVARLVTTCSLTVTLLAARSAVQLLRPQGRAEPTAEYVGSRRFYTLLSLTVLAHLFAVLIERKMFPYHYTRVFFAIAPLAAASVLALYTAFQALWLRARAFSGLRQAILRLSIVILVCLTLFYSPLVKFAVQTASWSLVRVTGRNAHEEVQQRTAEYFAADQASVANYVRATTRGSIFVWGNDVGIYFFADKLPTTFCLTATPFRTAWTPAIWKSMLIEQLEGQPPELFISEFGDAKSFITASPLDSHAALEQWPELRQFLANGYRPDTTIGHFHLYRRVPR